MPFPSNRQEFTDKCLRALGFPVLEINLDEDQIADRVDDALQKYWDFHTDGVEKIYMKYQLTANDISNTSIPIPDSVCSVTRIFPFNSGLTTSTNMFDVRYQYMLNNLPNFTSLSYVDYEITMMHLEQLNFFFNGVPGIRFNKNTNTLYLDIDWHVDVQAGSWIIIEGYKILDPDTYSDVWKDPWLRKYATALLKQQWGTNMKKFNGVAILGGITMNGQQIYDESVAEITALEIELRDVWEEPPQFRMG